MTIKREGVTEVKGMRLRSFQMRILVWTWAILLGVLAVVFYYSTDMVEDEVVRETKASSVRGLETVKWLIGEHERFASIKDFAGWVDELGYKTGARITFIHKGKVIADSEVPFSDLDSLDDHGSRPEVIAAHIDGFGSNIRYSDTLGKDMLYVATKVSCNCVDGVKDGVLRLAVPFSEVSSRLGVLERNFILIFLLALVLAFLVSIVMSRNMSRSIESFSELAQSIGEGDYSMRLRVLPGGEFMPLARSVNKMAESIERNIRVIEDQKGQLSAVFEGMREGVMTLDTEGRITSYNAALDEMFNLAETTLGRTPIEVTRRFEIQDMVENVMSDPDSNEQSIQIDLMDSRTVEISAVPFFDVTKARKLMLVFHDITEMKQSEKGLKNFVANASHQLRTPLTSIKGYTETLLDNPPANPEDGKYFLETVIKNADHMDKVISSMLALAKSEQMGKRLKLEAMSGREHLSRAVCDVTPWAEEHDISIEMNTPEGDLSVMAETDGLLHVFHNLLNNAIKYSPDGGVIRVKAEDDGESIVFTVEDQGPGISREHSTKVFERFYRVDENTIDGSGSSGLGLAICRRIVKNFGGEIWHDGYGEDTRGARFCFRLDKSS